MERARDVGALAVASDGANAIGAVRLSLGETAIEVELVRVAPFSQGFAPGAVAEAVRFTAPYAAVRGLVRRRRTLCLAFDPRVIAPYNRFALMHFTDDPAEALVEAWRARRRIRWVAFTVPIPVGLAIAALLPSDLAGGALGVSAVAALVAALTHAALREVVSLVSAGGAQAVALGEAFEADLSHRLGLAPQATRPAAVPLPTIEPFAAEGGRAPSSTPPRLVAPPLAVSPGAPETEPAPWRLPLTLGLAAAGAVLTLAVLAHWSRTPPPEPPRPAASVEASESASAEVVPSAALERSPPPAPEPPRAGPPCFCARADSPVWREGIPVLAVLVSPHEGAHVKPGRVDLDVAAVNDAARPLRDVRVVLTFARRSPTGKRVGVTDRGLFWAGALAPGQAVKWRVRAPGTEWRIDTSVAGTLGDDPANPSDGALSAGPAPAPPEAFAPLATAHLRSVRMHAATMLAYLRDPKALDAARELGTTSPEEAVTLAALERAAAPVFACGLRAEGDTLTVCVMNGSTEPATGLSLREVAAPRPGTEASPAEPPPARAWPLAGAIPVHEGARVQVALDGKPAPGEVTLERDAR